MIQEIHVMLHQKDIAQRVKITQHKLTVLDAAGNVERKSLNHQHYKGEKGMLINYFDKVRFESEHNGGVFADVKAFPDGCSSGFMVTAYDIGSYDKDFARHKVEVRRKERLTALFVYKYDDSEIDDWWKDAEVLYSWTQPGKDDEQ